MKTLFFIIALLATMTLLYFAFEIPMTELCKKAFWALLGYYSHYFLAKNEPV
jgi:uncharacterized membrane protein YjjB (DUF3815 family)